MSANIKIWGIPQDVEQSTLNGIRKLLISVIESIEELNLRDGQSLISVFFPKDQTYLVESDRKIIIEATVSPFKSKKLSNETADVIARNMHDVLRNYFPNYWTISCKVFEPLEKTQYSSC